MPTINVAIVGSGQIALANHLPGFALCPNARVTALCDSNPAALDKAAQLTGLSTTYTSYQDLLVRDDIHAVLIATPNHLHAPIALAAIHAGKHVLCEKPIALNLQQAREMYHAAEEAKIVHMAAFTYRFVPAMRYMAHLVHQGHIGTPYHFRAQRFQDWGARNLAWRQQAQFAGTGELGDMLSHRIDYAHLLLGQITRLVATTRRFIDRRGNQVADVEDFVSLLADFHCGGTGVLESTKLATGRGEGGRSLDCCEVNGSEGSLVYYLHRPHELQVGVKGGSGLQAVPVPEEFLKWPNSPRDPRAGDPLVAFRYDQDVEFIDAIANHRPAVPSFREGLAVQAVMDAALLSASQQRWVEIPQAI